MPSGFDQLNESPKKRKTVKSAFDSESFDADGTIHVEGLVGSATISPSGRDVALASPEGLAIIDLDSPYSQPRRVSSHGLPWLVVDVQWSPFAVRDYWVASTANHRCLVWNLNMRDDSSSGAIEHSLEGHSRAITDINFSAHHPDRLSTCAVDGYVHCWDLRKPRQPVMTFCDWFAGATQVKYNRQDEHILASSHDRWLHIWDDRKAAEPLKSIDAHTSKIYGVDWNRTTATRVVTCSLDKSIKFWNYANEDDVAERVIRTDFPVWRARHTPFGSGLLAMPQNEPGNLYLFDRRTPEGDMPEGVPNDAHADPVAIFPGHGNHKVKEFLWRSRGGISDEGLDNREFQLVSWGEDNDLRLHRPEADQLAEVGFIKGAIARKNFSTTRKGATYKTFRIVGDGSQPDRRTATMSDPRPGGAHNRRSALTMSMQAPHHRIGTAWSRPSMKAKTTSSHSVDKSHAQIGWMKGVTMSKKRKGFPDTPQRANSKDSTMFSPGYPHLDDWAEPETIQEEFLRVETQLPNVKWENVDMDKLSLKASLKGPWGKDGDRIFIKLRVDIPSSYPKMKAPKFFIEKSSFMLEETHKTLEEGIQQLTSQFLKRKKNCLDVALKYLLGEVDLESSTNFFKNVRDLDDEIDGLADESSSDEDDTEIPAGESVSMSQDLTASTELDNTLAPTLRPIVPPVVRTCGARFSNDGKLICFFPTKEEKAKAMLFTPTEPSRERPKGEPNFAGFGRLARDSPPPRQKYANDDGSGTDDHSDTDDSGDSSSSSDSELTTMHKISLWDPPRYKFRKAWSGNDSVRSSGGGTGAGTGTGTGTSKRRIAKPKNILPIYDMSESLPSKRDFAEEYAIFGDGAEVCEHNASVAEKHGKMDLVDIWRYSAMLLRSDIPLKMDNRRPSQRRRSVLVIAREAVSKYRDNGKGDDELLTGRVKWGHHPLAQEFVNDLFDHFEQLADVQMLAMLSCIFGESSAEDDVAYAESHLTMPDTPLPMKAPSFSLEYFPSNPDLWNAQTYQQSRSQMSSAVTTPRTAHTPIFYSGSQGSDDGLWTGDPASNSYSCGETPPLKMGRELAVGDGDQTPSLSTSPNNRLFRRSNSAIAATFTASLPRTLSGFVISSSPPEPPTRKKPSPVEAMLSNLAQPNWGGSTVFGSNAATESGTAQTSASDEYRRDEIMTMVAVDVTVHTENDRLFDDDGWLATPLLEPSRNAMYANYRYAYAEMLQMWSLPLARLEIMKFNVFKDESSGSGFFGDSTADSSFHDSYTIDAASAHSHTHSVSTIHPHPTTTPGATSPTMLLGTRREHLQSLRDSGRGLDVTGLCLECELQLEPLEYHSSHHLSASNNPSPPPPTPYSSSAMNPGTATGGAAGSCTRCHRIQRQLRCVYCLEPLGALYPPCLGCGCAFHDACLAEWHGAGETECPAGDECVCTAEASNGIVESWTALRAAMASDLDRMRREEEEKNRVGQPGKGILKKTPSTKTSGAAALLGRARRKSVPASMPLEGEQEGGGSSRASLYGADDDHDDWENLDSASAAPATSTIGSADIAAAPLKKAATSGAGGVGKPSPLGAGSESATQAASGSGSGRGAAPGPLVASAARLLRPGMLRMKSSGGAQLPRR